MLMIIKFQVQNNPGGPELKALKFKSLAGVKLRTLAAHMHAVIARLSHAIGGGRGVTQTCSHSIRSHACALESSKINNLKWHNIEQ